MSTTTLNTPRSVVFEFTVFDEHGEQMGTNVGGKPNVFDPGTGEILPALERELIDMKVGEKRSIVLPPSDAYGPVQPEAFREFPLTSIPEETRQVGRKVMGRTSDGDEEIFDVVEIRGDKVVIDMNHPMAGRTLRFDVRVLQLIPESTHAH